MDDEIRSKFKDLYGSDRKLQNEAFFTILKVTENPVDWAYDVWDQAVDNLQHKDNHNRAIAAQLLCNLAKSDPERRMLDDFGKLIVVTRDGRFVTARHCLQALWKVGLAGKEQQKLVVDGMAGRFEDCSAEKNCTLIRYDIIQGLRKLYDAVKEEDIKQKALELIETEKDLKYRRKYQTVWKA
jgi:hypothetical protein